MALIQGAHRSDYEAKRNTRPPVPLSYPRRRHPLARPRMLAWPAASGGRHSKNFGKGQGGLTDFGVGARALAAVR